MAPIKVGLFGGNGAFGKFITKALLKNRQADLTVFTRINSTTEPPAGVKVVKVDYESRSDLASKLKGFEVIVSCAGMAGVAGQTTLIDAAVDAGVKRILPSEFGGDYSDPLLAAVPLMKGKIDVRKYVEAVAAEGKITYTYVVMGAGLEYGLDTGFLGIDVKNHTARLVDGGVNKVAVTTMNNIGEAVSGVLNHLDATANRAVFVQDAALSQLDIIAILEKAQSTKYKIESDIQHDDLYNSGLEALQKGDIGAAAFGLLIGVLMRPGGGGVVEHPDNEALGMPKEDVTAVISSYVA